MRITSYIIFFIAPTAKFKFIYDISGALRPCELSFFSTIYITQATEDSLPYYLSLAGEEDINSFLSQGN